MASALPGPGVVPALPLLQAAAKACGELPTRSLTTAPGLSYHLDLTADGMSADELRDFEFAFDDENATEGTYHAYYFTKARPGHHTGPHTTSLAGCTPILKDYR